MFAAPSLHIGALLDLGYATDTAALSEFYIDVFLDYDYSLYLGKSLKDMENGTYKIYRKKNPGTSWFSGGIGISKRFYAASGGFFFAPALQFGAGGGWGSYGKGKDAEFVKITFTPQLHFGWSTSPDFDFIIKAGWNLGALVKQELQDIEKANFKKFAHGLFFSFDFNFHLPVVGATAKMYKAPSKACPVKKDDQADKTTDDISGFSEEDSETDEASGTEGSEEGGKDSGEDDESEDTTEDDFEFDEDE